MAANAAPGRGPEPEHRHAGHQHAPDAGGHEPGPAPGLARVAVAVSARQRGARLRRGLLASALTVVLLALALEVGLRLAHDRERACARGADRSSPRWVELTRRRVFEELPDDVRRYGMRPGASAVVDGWTFRVSSHRTRGEDFAAAKPPDEKRILALGDSFCFGMWCDEDQTLVGHLARLASEGERAAGSPVTWRAVNLGVPGYHTDQQLRAFEQDGLELAPDLVVLYFNTNDLERPGFFFDEDLGILRNDFLPLPIALRRLLWRSHLYGFLTRRYTELLAARPEPFLDPAVPYAWVREENQRATRAALERLVALCAERGIPLAMVNQPLMTWSGDARNPDWPVLPLARWAERLRAELGIVGIDLLGWMRGYADGVDRFPADPAEGGEPGFLLDRYFADAAVQAYLRGEPFAMPAEPDFHLTGEGYGRIARLLYPVLRDARVLP